MEFCRTMSPIPECGLTEKGGGEGGKRKNKLNKFCMVFIVIKIVRA